jgi:hypothetical protein
VKKCEDLKVRKKTGTHQFQSTSPPWGVWGWKLRRNELQVLIR